MTEKLAINEPFNIRQSDIQDADRIRILSEQLGYSSTLKQIEQRLKKIQSNATHILYVATIINDYVVAWGHASVTDLLMLPNQVILWGLVVDENYQNQGIGQALIQSIEQWANQIGCAGIMLYSNIKRQETHLFYEKNGYSNIKQSLVFAKSLDHDSFYQSS